MSSRHNYPSRHWRSVNHSPLLRGHAAEPSNEDFALRFALNGMLRAIASCPKEETGAEARRAKSGMKTARDILRQRGLSPVAAESEPTNTKPNEEHTS